MYYIPIVKCKNGGKRVKSESLGKNKKIKNKKKICQVERNETFLKFIEMNVNNLSNNDIKIVRSFSHEAYLSKIII